MMRLVHLLILTLGLVGALNADAVAKGGAVGNASLRLELLELARKDQEIRREITRVTKQFERNGTSHSARSLTESQQADLSLLSEKMVRIDSANTERMIQIVERHGWPTFDLVGKDGAEAAWILIQHADQSPEFQRKCLNLMTSLPHEQVSQKKVAYLTDRVLLAEGKKQVYGTQVVQEGGTFNPRPLEDEGGVDKRRAAVGLPPLAEYLKQIEEVYGGGSEQ